jgi:hypothetical protein
MGGQHSKKSLKSFQEKGIVKKIHRAWGFLCGGYDGGGGRFRESIGYTDGPDARKPARKRRKGAIDDL